MVEQPGQFPAMWTPDVKALGTLLPDRVSQLTEYCSMSMNVHAPSNWLPTYNTVAYLVPVMFKLVEYFLVNLVYFNRNSTGRKLWYISITELPSLNRIESHTQFFC